MGKHSDLYHAACRLLIRVGTEGVVNSQQNAVIELYEATAAFEADDKGYDPDLDIDPKPVLTELTELTESERYGLAAAEDDPREIMEAVKRSDLDVSRCKCCSKLVVVLPDGLPMCSACGGRWGRRHRASSTRHGWSG